MSELPGIFYFHLSLVLFCSGLYVVIAKRNIVFVLIGVELILNGANLLLINFSAADGTLNGQVFAIFSIVITVCEVAVALAILLNVFNKFGTSDLDELKEVGNE